MDPDSPTTYNLQPITLSILFLIVILFSPFTRVLAAAPVGSSVIRPAPDVTWYQGGHLEHLSSLRGKPVLLLMAPSPRSWSFHRPLHELKDVYEHLATQKIICLAAFTQEEGRVPSNIPFITVANGATAASAYDISKGFAIAVIGTDGNLDCLSTHVLPGQRVDDLINASYENQAKLRRP